MVGISAIALQEGQRTLARKLRSAAVTNVAIKKWDENGLGDEPNNLAAINSLIGYRSCRYGKQLDLIITDQHSYRSADPFSDPAAGAFGPEFPGMFPEDVAQVLDGGRAFNGGNPPAEVSFNGAHVPNSQRNAPPQTIPRRRAESVVQRTASQFNRDLENLGQFRRRTRLARRPAKSAAGLDQGNVAEDHLCHALRRRLRHGYRERAEIYDLVRDAKITGFAIVSGDRHSFWRATRPRNCRQASSIP